MSFDLTTEERRLVLDLLQLWEAGHEVNHRRACECDWCETWDKCGDHQAATFESLQRKMEVGE